MRNIYIASCEKDGGIYRCELTGNGLEKMEKTALDRPMYMTVSDGKMYVLLREAFDSGESGMCSFLLDSDGKLTKESEVISTKGTVACHIYAEEERVYAVNYLSGSVIGFPDRLAVHQGCGKDPNRQDAPHTHFVGVTPDKAYLCVTDLGLDQIMFYDRDLNLKFSVQVPEGAGARHLAFSEDGNYLYCVNELASSVTVFRYEQEKTRILETYPTLPEGFTGKNLGAAIRVYQNKVYVSNRGQDTIAVFEICGEKLQLIKWIATGKEPRDFNIIGGVLICCNMLEDTVTVYSLEKENTLLCTIPVKTPICVI